MKKVLFIPNESESNGNTITDFTSESDKFACLVNRLHNVTRQQIKIMLGDWNADNFVWKFCKKG